MPRTRRSSLRRCLRGDPACGWGRDLRGVCAPRGVCDRRREGHGGRAPARAVRRSRRRPDLAWGRARRGGAARVGLPPRARGRRGPRLPHGRLPSALDRHLRVSRRARRARRPGCRAGARRAVRRDPVRLPRGEPSRSVRERRVDAPDSPLKAGNRSERGRCIGGTLGEPEEVAMRRRRWRRSPRNRGHSRCDRVLGRCRRPRAGGTRGATRDRGCGKGACCCDPGGREDACPADPRP